VCDLGACQPVTIADNQPYVNSLTTDGTTVYWSGNTRTGTAPYYIAKRHVDLSDSVRVIAPAETSAYAVVASATSVYWMASNHLRVCTLPDCSGGPADFIPAVGTGSCGYGMALVGSKLYWSCGADYNTNDGALWSLPLPLSTTTPVAIDPTPANPWTIVSDQSNIYWINSSSYTTDNQNRDGALYKARLSDGTVTALATQLTGDLGALAIGGGALYFSGSVVVNSTTYKSAVFRVPLPNGVGATLPPTFLDSSGVNAMVADDTYVYLADYSSGSLARCPVAGCTTAEVIAPGDGPTALAQDAVSVYWVSGGAGTATGKIRRMAK
jgi:hypothetical protein